jgi:SAM-dependent methyltransferase
MSLYAKYVWAPLLDWCMRQPPVLEHRRKVVPLARGRVLEVGIGSGLNLPYYDTPRVEKVWGLEPSPELRAVASARAANAGLHVEILDAAGEAVPMDDRFFDTVLTTWTMCSIADVPRALREMRRVLKPEGRLVFAEHGLSADAPVARWQNRLNPVWRILSGGCNMNRHIAPLVRDAGFRFEALETAYLEGPRVLTYTYWGTAAPA